MTTHVYKIRLLTNLHAGSGDAGYGVVDKLVQRDPVNDVPTIHASGIKGAIREFFSDKKASQDEIDIFGSRVKQDKTNTAANKEPTGDEEQSESADFDDRHLRKGQVNFMAADLILIPRPVTDGGKAKLYELVYANEQVDGFDEKASYFDAKFEALHAGKNGLARTQVQGEVEDSRGFQTLCQDLPVVARNYLEDGGISKNLWYEEFVPRESVFLTFVQGEDGPVKALRTAIDGKIIQLGGNATVGYGYCLFTCLNP